MNELRIRDDREKLRQRCQQHCENNVNEFLFSLLLVCVKFHLHIPGRCFWLLYLLIAFGGFNVEG